MPDNEVAYRDARADDIAFCLDSWLRSWRTCPSAGTIRNDMYFPVQRATIEGLIGRGAKITVACLASDDSKILGWVCYEITSQNETVIHYLYVKDAYIQFGLGSQLVARCPGTKPGLFTHRYRQVIDSLGDHHAWRWAPEAARRK